VGDVSIKWRPANSLVYLRPKTRIEKRVFDINYNLGTVTPGLPFHVVKNTLPLFLAAIRVFLLARALQISDKDKHQPTT